MCMTLILVHNKCYFYSINKAACNSEERNSVSTGKFFHGKCFLCNRPQMIGFPDVNKRTWLSMETE